MYVKLWVIIFYSVQGYVHRSCESAKGFLVAYQQFTSLESHPEELWSDMGNSFVRASPALQDLYAFLERLEKPKLEDEATKLCTEWSWKIHPA